MGPYFYSLKHVRYTRYILLQWIGFCSTSMHVQLYLKIFIANNEKNLEFVLVLRELQEGNGFARITGRIFAFSRTFWRKETLSFVPAFVCIGCNLRLCFSWLTLDGSVHIARFSMKVHSYMFAQKEISNKVRGLTRSENAQHLLVWVYREHRVHIS